MAFGWDIAIRSRPQAVWTPCAMAISQAPRVRLPLDAFPARSRSLPREQAVAATEELFAAQEREAEGQRRLAREQEDREWRAAFKPHAVIQTERTVPSQITICGLTGGAGPRLIIPFDLSKGPLTFIQQATGALPRRHKDGRRYVMFFGEALGVIINYSPDHAVRCDLEGNPLELLPKAYRVGEVQLSVGGKRVDPKVMAKILGAADGPAPGTVPFHRRRTAAQAT